MAGVPGLPPKPEISDYNMENDAEMLRYQEKTQQYNRILTLITQTKSEEAATRSNMDKARHDAVMQMVSNLKS